MSADPESRNPPVELSRMRELDLDEIMRVERLSFSSPWKRDMFLEELNRHHSVTWVARAAGLSARPLIGYVMFWLIADELHILNIAVDPDWRQMGIGTRLMETVLTAAKGHQSALIVLDVRPANRAARKLYERFGFRTVGVRPQYYSDTGEDALVMVREAPFEPMRPGKPAGGSPASEGNP